MTDFTHDEAAISWIAAANTAEADFPIQNLPFGVFRRTGTAEDFRCGVAIGDMVLDLRQVAATGLLKGLAAAAAAACGGSLLNPLLALGPPAWRALRHGLFELLDVSASAEVVRRVSSCLVARAEVEHTVPISIGDYTDYFTSIHHAINGGRLLDPQFQLARNFQWLPMAYHGRVSSIGVSGQHVRRPKGQQFLPELGAPVYRPTQRLDFELELGVVIGQGNKLGEPISLDRADDHVFGICLLNDWSARDIQAWEMAPLGPFQSKNFATTLSPWIITMDALAPYRVAHVRTLDGPPPLPHLDSVRNREFGALDIRLQALIETAEMRTSGLPPQSISAPHFAHQYWTLAQMITHHTAGGCNLQVGDLLGTGTISDAEVENAGSMIELSLAGKKPIRLKDGTSRSFIEDGDTIVFRGWCERDGFRRIGFGTNHGIVLPAHEVG